MNILTVVHDLNEGGVQRSAFNFALEFINQGHNVAILLEEAGGEYAFRLRNHGAEIFVNEGNSEKQQAVEFDPDLIHVHSHCLNESLVRYLDKETTAKMIEHVVWDDRSPYDKHIDIRCLMSEFGLWRLETSAQPLQENSSNVIIPNPVRTEDFYPASEEEVKSFKSQWDIPVESLVLGRVGQSIPSKWSPLILSTFYKIAKEYNDAYLLLRGAPRDLIETVDLFPEEIRNRIIHLPFLNNNQLRQCYSAIDVFLHTARRGETFGNVLVESMLCGTPIVTLSTPYNDNAQVEVVGHNVGGIVATTEAQFINATENLCALPELRDVLGKQGRDKAKTEFNIESVAKKVLDCYSGSYKPMSTSTSEIVSLLENTVGGVTMSQRLLLKSRYYQEYFSKSILGLNDSPWGKLMRTATGHDLHLRNFEKINNLEEIKVNLSTSG